ncbi:hypothetical protein BDR07DRAFT_1489030 [Suillus spraguei]|nr:hypothetical protein BDR07DRAFT_1489030 [Suillus spraguei]
MFLVTVLFEVDSTAPLQFPATSPLPHPLINPDGHSLPTPAPPTTQSSTDHIVNVPLAPGKLRHAVAGAPGDDDSLIRVEDHVPPPSLNTGSCPGSVNAGQHGRGRFCFCF